MRQQSASHEVEVRKRYQGKGPCRVLLKATVPDLGELPQPFDDVEGVLDPTYSAAWKLLGKVFTEAGRTDETIKTYEDSIRAAEEKGDKQATREMAVFLKRLQKT